MLEIGIRTLSLKKGTRISNDYREQMELIKKWMKGKIKSSLKETDSISIYQYYSMAPFYCVEARFLRRMKVGSSVMCVKESLENYVAPAHLPRFIKQFLYLYIKIFLNSLDYIVTVDEKTEMTLRQEGVNNPRFYRIPICEEKEPLVAGLWMDFYQTIAVSI